MTWVDDDGDYAALFVGDVSGAHDVPVRTVGEEVLLIEEGTACCRRRF
jgi:hypothetical protein